MLQRSDLLIKAICGLAAAVVVFQAGRLALRGSPLANVRIPQLPSLTNTPARTNPPSAANSVEIKKGGEPQKKSGGETAERTASLSNTVSQTTNVSAAAVTSAIPSSLSATSGAHSAVSPASTAAVAAAKAPMSPRPGAMVMGRPGMGPGGPRGPVAPLPKSIQAKVDRITDSELLGPVMRPMPMALLGIAGEHVFLRASNGQTGLVKVGDTLGGIKLLKIGINRVLVEEDGQERELTIFSGMGGESLLASAKTPKTGEQTSKSKVENSKKAETEKENNAKPIPKPDGH